MVEKLSSSGSEILHVACMVAAAATVARSQTYPWASLAKKVRPLKKKLGHKHLQLELYGLASHKLVAILSKQIVRPR